MSNLEEKIKNALQNVLYKNGNVLEADIIETLEVKNDIAKVTLYPLDEPESELERISKDIANSLRAIEEINEVEVLTVEEELKEKPLPVTPNPALANAAPKNNSYLQNYKNIILISSGKGGVGKSTVALNLALALKKKGKLISIFDADVYGPSLPLLMKLRGIKPKIHGQQMLPLSKFGIEFMSIGSLVSEGDSLVWRGPMVHQAIEQLIRDTVWPGGDYMIIDMPPGTGDIQISISQMMEVTGTLIVCTPQDVALIDARRALAMYEKVDIPVLGMIENMSGFICPNCNHETPIFGKGGVEQDSKNFNLPLLGTIPIDLAVRTGSDSGKPIMEQDPDSLPAQRFIEVADSLNRILEEK